MLDSARLRAAYEQVKSELLAERTPDGHWIGELSSSALATATAVSALASVRRVQGSGFRVQEEMASGGREPPETAETLDSLISRGVRYLVTQQNHDGGFGDTDLSHSNIATTYLVIAALHLAGMADQHADLLTRANAYIDSKGQVAGLRERYGIDKTFVVPIMTNLALAGLIDWREIDPLPFELACVPQSLYRFVGMPVVSYAIPALVAIGHARYFHAPPRNPITRLVRWLSIKRSLAVLRRMQPDSGGYLEATPLTSFVVMSLASVTKPRPVVGVNAELTPGSESGTAFTAQQIAPRPVVGALNPIAGEVIREGIKFLANSIRPDGSWPIDTNLATWNTTLSINALAGADEDVAELLAPRAVGNAVPGVPGASVEAARADHGTAQRPFPTGNVLDWLLTCQHLKRHPFTGADPGGFGWSDLSGAVPDADDTPGALLALRAWRSSAECSPLESQRISASVLSAVTWLHRLQNRDGGWPTFCRGWGRLPFDRSGNDLTAHVLRAFWSWPLDEDSLTLLPFGAAADLDSGKVVWYLKAHQHPDGSWSPLWFGNQDHPTEDNPVYGTAKVLMAYRDLGLMDSPEAKRGVAWLVANQNADGGWGTGVWGKARSAELAARSGVDPGESATDSKASGNSVLSTEYSVLGSHDALNPKSKIQNLKSSIEETSLAVEALLAAWVPTPDSRPPTSEQAAARKGLTWLVERVERGEHRQPAPIGFYFAKLWYYERLYPLIFTVAALGRACRELDSRQLAPLEHPASTGTTPWTTAAP